jgi:hypothetical protein
MYLGMTMTEVSKYLLETLWEDEEIVLSRGVRTGHSTILVVTPAKERPAPVTWCNFSAPTRFAANWTPLGRRHPSRWDTMMGGQPS